MKKIFVLLLAGFIAAPAGLYSQEVYKKAKAGALGGYIVVLDMTEAAGMPADAVTSTKKYTDGSVASNSTWIGGSYTLGAAMNAQVYEKLEIAPGDLNSDTTFGNGTIMNWANAYNRCKSSVHDNGGWRLPTQRELMMMWIFKPALNDIFVEVGGTMFSTTITDYPNDATSDLYWSATEITRHVRNTYAWQQGFDTGLMSDNFKTYFNRVRCVREL